MVGSHCITSPHHDGYNTRHLKYTSSTVSLPVVAPSPTCTPVLQDPAQAGECGLAAGAFQNQVCGEGCVEQARVKIKESKIHTVVRNTD